MIADFKAQMPNILCQPYDTKVKVGPKLEMEVVRKSFAGEGGVTFTPMPKASSVIVDRYH